MIQKTAFYFLWILLVCVVVEPLAAQSQSQLGSEDEIAQNPTEKQLQDHLEKLWYYDSINDRDSLEELIKEGKILCKKVDFTDTTQIDLQQTGADLYNFIASKEYAFNDLSSALISYHKAINIYKSVGIQYELAQCLNNIAIIYMKIGNQIKALDYLKQSTAIFTEIKDSIGQVSGYNSMSKIYREQNDNQQAQAYLDTALGIARELDKPGILASVLNSMAGLKKEWGDQTGALSLYQEALSASNYADNKIKTALVLNNLGVIHQKMGDLKQAKSYYDRAYKIVVENNAHFGLAFTLVNLADYNYVKEDYKNAEKLAQEALSIVEKSTNNEAKLKAIKVLIKIYEAQGNWKEIVVYQQLLIDEQKAREKRIREQITQKETLRLDLERKQNDSRNQAIKERLTNQIETQNYTLYYVFFIVAFVLLLVFALIIFIRLRTSRERNKTIIRQSEERKLLLQEVHHRVKNNFQLVSSMLRLQSYNFDNEELRQGFEEAVNRINAMAVVHDVIYRQEKFSDIDAKTYLEKLVENLHKTGDSRIVIEIDSEEIPFKIETLINLGIAINEMITNSFKHAFNEDILQPKIKISLSAIAEKTYELVYRDNGTGISEETYASNFGMELIDTIISNFDGSVELRPEKEWKTVILITFKEF